MADNKGNWYLKQNRHVTGPFSTAVIINHLTVGRLSPYDVVSTDASTWIPIRNIAELTSNLDKQALENAKRQLDERTGLDRRNAVTSSEEHTEQRGGERRQPESPETATHRALRRSILEKHAQQRRLILWPLAIVFILFVGLTVTAFLFPTLLPVPEPDCSAEAAPQVNWSNCLKPKSQLNNLDLSGAKLRSSLLADSQMINVTLNGADMAYANMQFIKLNYAQLQNVNLLGADLRQADLGNADLSHADLSFANLQAANLSQANLTGAKLDNAIWIDGRTCMVGSIGSCQFEP